MNCIATSLEEIDLHGANGHGVPPSQVSETAPFPIDCLPGPMRDIVNAVSTLERTPKGIAASIAIGIISATIGKTLRVNSLPGKVCPGNLYVLVVAPSGTNKSVTFQPIAKPLLKYESERIAMWRGSEYPKVFSELKFVRSRIKRIENQFTSRTNTEGPANLKNELQNLITQQEKLEIESKGPRLLSENATSESMQILLSQNGGCIASVSSDAREVMDVLAGRYRSGGGTDEGIYLKGFSLEDHITDRVQRGNVSIKETCISVLWLVQPDKLAAIMTKRSLSDSGLLPRFLMYHADFLPAPLDPSVPGISPEVEIAWGNLVRILIETYRLGKEVKILSPNTQAKNLLYKHYNDILNRRRIELKSLNEYAARWNEQAWRLCVVLHAAIHGATAHAHELNEVTAQAAITIADWFANQQLELLGWTNERAEAELQTRVLALAKQSGEEGIIATDIYRSRIVANAETARELLTKMAEDGKLRVEKIPRPGGGWISERFFQP